MPQATEVIAARPALDTPHAVLARYPRICAHVICESLGYATPTLAASILLAVIQGRPHFCEWLAACHGSDPRLAVRNAIASRHYHRGFMADYPHALALVMRAVKTGREPDFASWF